MRASAAIWSAIAACLALAVFIQSRVLLNHDVAWVVHSAARLLDGGELGADIVAANPPLVWYLSLPAAWLARVTGLPDYQTIRFTTLLLVLAGLGLTWRAALPWRASGRAAEARALVIGAAVAVAVMAGASFGQREHLSLILALPYLVLAGIGGGSRALRVTVGVMAGLGFAFKPTLLAVPMLVELTNALAARRAAAVLRIETIAMAATGLVYLLVVVLAAPAYLTDVLPGFRDLYWGFENTTPAAMLARLAPGGLMIAVAALALSAAGAWRRLHLILIAAALGYAASDLLQQKNYAYHAWPALATSLVVMVLGLTAALVAWRAMPRGVSHRWRRPALICAAILGVLLAVRAARAEAEWLADAGAGGGAGQERRELIAAVRSLLVEGDDLVFAMSTHPYPGFPTVNYVGGRWAGRSNSSVEVPAVVKLAQLADPVERAEILATARAFRRRVVADLVARRPRVVLVDARRSRHAIGRRRFDFLEYYGEEPGFAELWASYEEVTPRRGIRIFVRRQPR